MARDHARSDSMTAHTSAGQWRAAWSLAPYVWRYKGRVLAAFVLLLGGKLANVSVPLVLKEIVDRVGHVDASALAAPLLFVVLYGLLRFGNTAFTELRDAIFARVLQRAMRGAIHDVFKHLHAQSLRFHLERRTGGIAVDIERGARSIRFLINFTLFNIGPTLLEILMVAGVLFAKYDPWFGGITLLTLAVYLAFTIAITNWRLQFRRAMNESDSRANARAVDSLLNYETVKYFNNEEYEARRYDENLRKYEAAAVKNEASLGLLNIGQSFIIAIAVTLLMILAAGGVVDKTLTLGDLVLINGLLIQLYIPLNFLGMVYREIKQALIDTDRMFRLLQQNREIADSPNAVTLAAGSASIRFEHVDFFYDPKRQILFDVSFDVPAGSKVAVVGHSGAGKSTLARLLYRFYDVSRGAIIINGSDIRAVQQGSLRGAIGIVPQDTVLFNDTIYYNIQYGRPEATHEEIIGAAKAAHIHDFVESLPDKYQARVGERGLKLSGGEKQRVAIARALLKNPSILIFDEATSALDSETEKSIQGELARIAQGHTTLVIAHRLSTVMDADQILVMDDGRIIERGAHRELLDRDGAYAQMWALQQQEESKQARDKAVA